MKTDLDSNDLVSTPTTPDQEAAARRVVARQPDAHQLLQMLGLEPYDSGRPPPDDPQVQHGKRSTYVNGRCAGTDCPASPTCLEQNTAYFRRRRAAARRASDITRNVA